MKTADERRAIAAATSTSEEVQLTAVKKLRVHPSVR